ncbi:MAG: ZPR1 zinc finger domain-containing protein [Nanoarchaeota archaeon]|nr:ZPR1 zinc finger domain-containing protein [Nanoarchaeota archaeon]
MSEKDRDILLIENQMCPVCSKNKATFSEYEIEDAFAGTIAIFSIKCTACGFKNSDLEFINPGSPAEYSIDIESRDDLDIRVIKAGVCEVIIPNFRISVDSSMASEGFISNIEGVIVRFKKQIEFLKEDSDLDKTQRKKLKNILKGIEEVLAGEKKITLKLKDETGNSAIVSDKVKIKKLKV